MTRAPAHALNSYSGAGTLYSRIDSNTAGNGSKLACATARQPRRADRPALVPVTKHSPVFSRHCGPTCCQFDLTFWPVVSLGARGALPCQTAPTRADPCCTCSSCTSKLSCLFEPGPHPNGLDFPGLVFVSPLTVHRCESFAECLT